MNKREFIDKCAEFGIISMIPAKTILPNSRLTKAMSICGSSHCNTCPLEYFCEDHSDYYLINEEDQQYIKDKYPEYSV